MTEAQLQSWLAKRLKLPVLPDLIWEMLVAESGDAVEAALENERNEFGDDPKDDVLAIARRYLRYIRVVQGVQPPPTTERKSRPAEMLNEYEAARARAYSEVVASWAEAEPEVRRFRKKIAGQSMFPPEQMAELKNVSVALTQRYPWTAQQAAEFVVFDRTPEITPVRVSDHGFERDKLRYQIFLAVEPWVSSDTVLRSYRRAQRIVLGGDNRPLSHRSLALLTFVSDWTEIRGTRPSWEQLMRLWNRKCPDWYVSDPRRFARDVKRVEESVLFPWYRGLPGWGEDIDEETFLNADLYADGGENE